jgi:hypothetical protein
VRVLLAALVVYSELYDIAIVEFKRPGLRVDGRQTNKIEESTQRRLCISNEELPISPSPNFHMSTRNDPGFKGNNFRTANANEPMVTVIDKAPDPERYVSLLDVA